MISGTDEILFDRLDLRPLAPADADEMVDVLGDPRLYEFIGGGPLTLDELRDQYRRPHVASAGVAARAGLTPTDELVDGERVWRRPQPNHNPGVPASTDESR